VLTVGEKGLLMHRECEEILQAIGHSILILDPELNIIWANETAKKLFGDSIIGEKCYEVYHKRKAPCEPYPCLTLKAFMDGKIHEHETQVTDQHGKIRYFHCLANVAIEDQDRNPTAVLEISRDISERKWAEEALRQSEEKYRRLIETTDTGYVIIDSTGRVLDANLKYVAMAGHQTLDEILGRTVTE
jgi:PAS domain S-box-containing protein